MTHHVFLPYSGIISSCFIFVFKRVSLLFSFLMLLRYLRRLMSIICGLFGCG